MLCLGVTPFPYGVFTGACSLTARYSRTERGGWWHYGNTAHNVGGVLIPLDGSERAALRLARWDDVLIGKWRRSSGIFSAGGCADCLALVYRQLVNGGNDAPEIAQQQEGAGLTRKEILTKYVLLNPYIWLLCLLCKLV